MLWLGIGCKRDTLADVINQSMQQLCRDYCLQIRDFQGIATLDTKGNEPGIITVCRLYNLPLKLFSAPVLAQVSLINPSTQVFKYVNTPSVAEAAAMMAVSQQLKLSNFPNTQSKRPVLLIPKTIFEQKNLGVVNFVTLAVASVIDGNTANQMNQQGHNTGNAQKYHQANDSSRKASDSESTTGG